MADNTDQADTSNDDAVATQDVDELSFEDMASMDDDESLEEVAEDDGQEGTEDTSEEAEAEESEESDENANSDEAEEEAEAEAESEDTTDEDTKGKPDPDKAREAYIRRQVQREEREKAEKAQLEQYLKEAKDDSEELARRQLQVDQFNLSKQQSDINEQTLTIGVQRAKAEIPLLGSSDPAVLDAFGDAMDEFQERFVVMNEYGDIVQVKADVYQFLQNKADTISKLTGIRETQAAKAKKEAKARTTPTPSRAPKEKPADKDLDAFDEEMNKTWN